MILPYKQNFYSYISKEQKKENMIFHDMNYEKKFKKL